MCLQIKFSRQSGGAKPSIKIFSSGLGDLYLLFSNLEVRPMHKEYIITGTFAAISISITYDTLYWNQNCLHLYVKLELEKDDYPINRWLPRQSSSLDEYFPEVSVLFFFFHFYLLSFLSLLT
jgi:hypothetical protein